MSEVEGGVSEKVRLKQSLKAHASPSRTDFFSDVRNISGTVAAEAASDVAPVGCLCRWAWRRGVSDAGSGEPRSNRQAWGQRGSVP